MTLSRLIIIDKLEVVGLFAIISLKFVLLSH